MKIDIFELVFKFTSPGDSSRECGQVSKEGLHWNTRVEDDKGR